ncbi:MAG: PilZ domain-containing protein [Thermodesulfobacteriota bacterium]
MSMKNPPHSKERRGHRRIVMSFPVNVCLHQSDRPYPGLTVDASESGLLIQTLKDMPLETTLNIGLLFPKDSNLTNFKAVAKVVWKDICNWEDLEGYQYGLKFIQISDEDYSMLKKFLADPSFTKEAQLVDDSEHQATLVVKVEK